MPLGGKGGAPGGIIGNPPGPGGKGGRAEEAYVSVWREGEGFEGTHDHHIHREVHQILVVRRKVQEEEAELDAEVRTRTLRAVGPVRSRKQR